MKKLYTYILILSSCNVYAQNATEFNFFHAARVAYTYKFIENGNIFNIRVDDRDQEGNTLLHYAASYGHLEIARLLMLVDANPYLRNNQGQTPLQLAINTRDIFRQNFCNLFANCSAYINDVGDARDQYLEFDVQSWFYRYREQLSIINLLSEFQPASSDSSTSHIRPAPDMANVELALTVWVKDPSLIIGSAEQYPDDIWQLFLHRIAIDVSIDLNIKRYGSNLFHQAVGSGRIDVVEALIDRGIDNINELYRGDRTALDIANRAADRNKRSICNITEMPDDLCTDTYIQNLELTPRQNLFWAEEFQEWHNHYLTYYNMAEFLKLHGAEEASMLEEAQF